MNKLKKCFVTTMIFLSSTTVLHADELNDSVVVTDHETIQRLRQDFIYSPSAQRYIDKLATYKSMDKEAMNILMLNLTASKNADLEASAEGRTAATDDIERHKGYIIKAQSVQVTQPEFAEETPVQNIERNNSITENSLSEESTEEPTPRHGKTLSEIMERESQGIEALSSLVINLMYPIMIIFALMFVVSKCVTGNRNSEEP